jgi:hypothetical protein
MKNYKLILKTLLFCMLLGCSKSKESKIVDSSTFLTTLNVAPSVYVLKENLPEWLVIRINDYYKIENSSIRKVQVYRGEWNLQAIYFIMDTFSSCLCDFFTEDGEKLNNNSLINIYSTSKNWILIYKV